MHDPDMGDWSYGYDAVGNLTTQTDARGQTLFNGQRVAMNKAGVVYYIAADHLGTTSVVLDSSGNKVTESRHPPYGTERWSSGTFPTDYRFTGQLYQASLGIYRMGARWYDPALSRWLSPDTLVPEAANPQSLNRYSYVLGNPLKYRDPSGRIAWLVIGAIALKALDYGWTAWDSYQSGRVLADPNASRGDKLMAGLNVAVAVVFEAVEPDDLIPLGLPADDMARKALLKAAREAYEEGGEEALERVIRDNLGEHADEVLKHLDEALEGGAKAGNLVTVKAKRLENLGIDAHAVKEALLGRGAPISRWDIALDKDTGLYWLVSKDPSIPPQLIGRLEDLQHLSEP